MLNVECFEYLLSKKQVFVWLTVTCLENLLVMEIKKHKYS